MIVNKAKLNKSNVNFYKFFDNITYSLYVCNIQCVSAKWNKFNNQ